MKKVLSLFISLFFIFILTSCGNDNNIINKISNVTDKQMTLNFTFGNRTGKYTGEVDENGLPNGKGKFESKNADGDSWSYEGNFKNGHFEGQGTTVWNDGQKQIGEFHNDFMTNGKLFKNENLLYEGRFENNIPMLESVEMNTEVSFADWTYKVTGIETASIIEGSLSTIKANGEFLIIMIDATNNGKNSKTINDDIKFVLFDESGREFESNTNAMVEKNSEIRRKFNIAEPAWYLSKINPGLTLQNIPIIFDVPKDIKNIKFLPQNGYGKVNPIKLR